MSIGKNAIKRVENNGYSQVKTGAPDMQNSTVIAKADEQVLAMVEKTPAKKTTAKKKAAPKKTEQKQGFIRFGFGEELPYYLL